MSKGFVTADISLNNVVFIGATLCLCTTVSKTGSSETVLLTVFNTALKKQTNKTASKTVSKDIESNKNAFLSTLS